MDIRSNVFHAVKAEGERHSVVIKQTRPNKAWTCWQANHPAVPRSISSQVETGTETD